MTVHLRSRFTQPLEERCRRRAFALAVVALLVAVAALTAIGQPSADATAHRSAPVASPRDGTAIPPGTVAAPFVQIGGE